MAMEGGHVIPGQGALPVFRDGVLVGPWAAAAARRRKTKTPLAPARPQWESRRRLLRNPVAEFSYRQTA